MKTIQYSLSSLAILLMATAQPTAGETSSTEGSVQNDRVLTPIQELFDPVNLDGARDIVVSPDGAHVYVASNQGSQFDVDSISHFSRESQNGLLTHVDTYVDGVNGIDGLFGVLEMAMSPDGECLFTAGLQLIAPFGLDGHVASFDRELSSGALSFVQAIGIMEPGSGDLRRPRAVAVSPDNQHVYVTHFFPSGIQVFSKNPQSCALVLIDEIVSVAGEPQLLGIDQIAISATGEQVYVSVFEIDDSNNSGLAVYDRDSVTGALTFSEVQIDDTAGVEGLGSAGKMALSPEQDHLYVCSESDQALAGFTRDPGSGTLTFLGAWFNGQDGIEGLTVCRDVAVSPSGDRVFTAGPNDSAIVIFGRDGKTGLLSYLGIEVDDMNGVNALGEVQSLAMSHDNENLYAASRIEDGLQVFRVAPANLFADGFESPEIR